jgi:hypothetical protein
VRIFGGYSSEPYRTPSGQAYEWYYRPRSRSSPPHSKLRFDAPLPVDFSLESEGVFSKLAKWLGCASEFQTGDVAFDDRFYIFSDDPPFHALLNSDQLRASISAIFAQGVERITAQKGKLIIDLAEASKIPDTEKMSVLIDDVLQLLKYIRQISTPSAGAGGRMMARRARIAIGGIFTLLFAGLAVLFWAPYRLVNKWELIETASWYSLLPMLGGFLLVQRLFQYSSLGKNVFMYYLTYGLIAMALATYALLYTANIYYDDSPPHLRTQRIVAKNVTHGSKGGTHYYIDTEHWRGNGEPFHTEINFHSYGRARIGDRLQLETHPGALQFEWIKSMQVGGL